MTLYFFASQAIPSTFPSNGVNLRWKKSQIPSRCFLTVPFFVSSAGRLRPVLHRAPGPGSPACARARGGASRTGAGAGGGASRAGAGAGSAAGLADVRVGRSLAACCLVPPPPARPPTAPSDSTAPATATDARDGRTVVCAPARAASSHHRPQAPCPPYLHQNLEEEL